MALRQRLVEAGALVGEANHETHFSLYAKDPDGLEFELTWFVPADQVPAGADLTASHPLDLDAEVRGSEVKAPADGGRGPGYEMVERSPDEVEFSNEEAS